MITFHKKSRTKLRGKEKPEITFKDVAGAEEAKQDLQEILAFLKHPKQFREMGAQLPNGVLLNGPPGTGKTCISLRIAKTRYAGRRRGPPDS